MVVLVLIYDQTKLLPRYQSGKETLHNGKSHVTPGVLKGPANDIDGCVSVARRRRIKVHAGGMAEKEKDRCWCLRWPQKA